MHRSPKAFERPDDFVPERWTKGPRQQLTPHNAAAFAPFLRGTYACIGKQLAYNEMRSVAAMLVLAFEVRFAEGEDGSGLLNASEDVFTMNVAPLWVVFEKRKDAGEER